MDEGTNHTEGDPGVAQLSQWQMKNMYAEIFELTRAQRQTMDNLTRILRTVDDTHRLVLGLHTAAETTAAAASSGQTPQGEQVVVASRRKLSGGVLPTVAEASLEAFDTTVTDSQPAPLGRSRRGLLDSCRQPNFDMASASQRITTEAIMPRDLEARASEHITKLSRCSLQSGMNSYSTSQYRFCANGLPMSWPVSIRMRKGLEPDADGLTPGQFRNMINEGRRGVSKKVSSKERLPSHTSKRRRSIHAEDTRRGLWFAAHATCMRRVLKLLASAVAAMFSVHDPSSKLITIFDFMGGVALFHDLVLTPYTLAWNFPLAGAQLAYATCAGLYWSVAMVFAFTTGFYENGVLNMNIEDIRRQYVSSKQFISDMFFIIDDWICIVASAGGLHGDITIGVLRLIKLCRANKVRRFAAAMPLLERYMGKYMTKVGTNISSLMFQVLRVVLCTVYCSHLTCCVWYAIGRMPGTDTGGHWVDPPSSNVTGVGRMGTLVVDEMDEPYQYVTAFHWTLAQITLGAMEITPTNSFERVFCIMLLLFGLVYSSIVVSVISSQAMEYVMMRREQTEKLSLLRRFLSQNDVELRLSVQVQRQVVERLTDNATPISEQDVPAIAMLSSTLRLELLRQTRTPHLLKHPLFRMWNDIDAPALFALCDEAVKFASLTPQDCVFMSGVYPDQAYFVARGRLRYSQDVETSMERCDVTTLVDENTWLCEAALWSHWVHVGKLEADTGCQLMIISALNLLQIVPRYPVAGYLTRYYGRAYHLRITTALPPQAPWPNDLEVPFTAPSDLLTTDCSLNLLRRMVQEKLVDMSPEESQKLEGELVAEKCAIQEDADGTMERVVAVVTIRLESAKNGRILVQIGTWKNGKVGNPKCTLPGTKRSRGELPHQALQRLIEEDLKAFSRHICLDRCETVMEVKDSDSVGLRTKYLKTVQYATLNSEFQDDELLRASWMGSLASVSNAPPSWVAEIMQQDVFMFKDGDTVQLYSWFDLADFESLRDDPSLLSIWVRGLRVDLTLFERWQSEDSRLYSELEIADELPSVGHTFAQDYLHPVTTVGV